MTGVLLMFYYIPSIDMAYNSMLDLEFAVSYGVILRNMHRWAAHAMVAFVFLHMCRVFYTASYKAPREFNWVIGICLLLMTLCLSFTGYLLPWDQLAFWAITVGTNIVAYVPWIGDDLRPWGGQRSARWPCSVSMCSMLLSFQRLSRLWWRCISGASARTVACRGRRMTERQIRPIIKEV